MLPATDEGGDRYISAISTATKSSSREMGNDATILFRMGKNISPVLIDFRKRPILLGKAFRALLGNMIGFMVLAKVMSCGIARIRVMSSSVQGSWR